MEPLIKRREDGMPVIRIDSPYDIRGVPARPHSQPGDGVSFGDKEPLAAHRHPLLDKLREDARVRYAKGDALGAVRRWQLALGYAQSNDDRALLMLNMALAHLRPDLNRPGEAMRLLEIVHCYEAEDRGPVLHTTEQRTKLYHRSAVAAYRLRRWPDATKWAKELSPSLREPLLAQLAAREAEYTNGSYDWLAIWNQLKAGEELDIADYRNPQVAVENIAGRGRGVVAQATLQAGTLLLVERPVAFTKPNPDRSAARLVGLNLATEVLMPPAQTALVKAAFMAANDNADRCEDLHDLYAGPNFPQPPTNGDRVRYRDTPLDAGWVEGAVVYNSFRVRCVTSPIGGVVKKGNDEDEEDDDGPSALYHFASMANHSCSPNATYCFFGSRFVMRTLRRITEGDEITISYVDQAANLIDRRQALKHHFPPEVVCSCALCETDAKTEYERRRQLLGAAKPFESHSAEALRKLFQRVARTYAVHPSSRSMPHDFMPELYPVGLARLRKLTSSDRYDLATMLLQIIGAYPSAEETTFTLFNVASILTIMTVAILSEKHPECSADISSSCVSPPV